MTYAEEDPQFLEHIKEAWPGLEEDEYPDLLMSVTAFPFARAPVIIDQLAGLYAESGGDIHKAMDIVDARVDASMNEYKRKQTSTEAGDD